MNHTELIQLLIDDSDYQSYLEIGYGQGNNFRAINVKNKVAIDPEGAENIEGVIKMTSDEYFSQLDGRTKFSIIFIDGLHHAGQVERDIINSMKHLKKGGVIVVHDILPDTIEMQEVPRIQRQWTGDVWRAWVGFVEGYPGIKTQTYSEDYGMGIIYHSTEKIDPGFSTNMPVDVFFSNKQGFLNGY